MAIHFHIIYRSYNNIVELPVFYQITKLSKLSGLFKYGITLTLRHTSVSHLAINGVSIFVMQKLLNRRDLNTQDFLKHIT